MCVCVGGGGGAGGPWIQRVRSVKVRRKEKHRRVNMYMLEISTHTPRGRKEVFYLTMYSTHFIYGYMASTL